MLVANPSEDGVTEVGAVELAGVDSVDELAMTRLLFDVEAKELVEVAEVSELVVLFDVSFMKNRGLEIWSPVPVKMSSPSATKRSTQTSSSSSSELGTMTLVQEKVVDDFTSKPAKMRSAII